MSEHDETIGFGFMFLLAYMGLVMTYIFIVKMAVLYQEWVPA